MLTADKRRIDKLGQERFLNEVYRFLDNRVRAADIRHALSNRESVLTVWRPLLPQLADCTEYRAAICLTYSLCAHVRGGNARASTKEFLAHPDSEFQAKAYFEDTEVFRFSEFDL